MERDKIENDILSIVCGTPPEHLQSHRCHAKAYIDYYYNEISAGVHLEHDDVLFLVKLLREHSGTKRSEIQSALMDWCNISGQPSNTAVPATLQAFTVTGSEIPRNLAGLLKEGGDRPGKALAVAVQVMLALKLGVMVEGGVRTLWKETQSLQEIVGELFPLCTPEDDISLIPIKKSKLRARYLHDYAHVKLVWTDDLSEHLKLRTDKVPRQLRIFQYVSLLEAAWRRTQDQEVLVEKRVMEGGYYDAGFLWETLMTYKLLFPFQDEQWLKAMITRGGDDGPKDLRLVSPATMEIPWSLRAYELLPRGTKELYKLYPHWGLRLQIIFEEAEDPTPVTAMSMWFDRHKASRHAFGITVFAFTVTILFGLLSLGVGGAQIWIALCTWRPTDSGICWTAPENGTSRK
ncbi:hypothetical protein MMYC01_205489 [Madurella mycetomatis]|uniref:Uncharacterized protein n=1 Tax=Madurella mycetomatis TaxID=100816 RepID=A0A175W4M5_9PEZI|nr:hypothetical protein MMYC01_205489 [Madurella mycetomatis]